MGPMLESAWPVLLLIGSIVVIIAVARVLIRDPRPPYEKRSSLLTKAELRFYHVLRDAVDGRWNIMAMVRMADLIRVKPNTDKRQAWQNRIHAKHIDFVLCDRDSLDIVLAIELDDRSHQRPDRVARDQFVNRALETADIPLLRVPVRGEYDPTELAKTIGKSLAT